MNKNKLVISTLTAVTLTLSTVFTTLPSVVYAQDSTSTETGVNDETTIITEEIPSDVEKSSTVDEKTTETQPVDDTTENDTATETGKGENNTTEAPNAMSEEDTSGIANRMTLQADNELSGECGATEADKVTWELIQNNTDTANPTYTLTISGTGAMKDFKYSKDKTTGKFGADTPWHAVLTRDAVTKMFPITELVIGNGVTYIGTAAFASLSVKNISFAPNVTGYGKYVFIDCALSETVDWTGFTPTAIPDGLLYGNSNLVNSKINETIWENKLVIPENIDAVGTSSFLSCTSLREIDLTNITKSIGENAFGSCTGLKTVKLPTAVDSGYETSYFGSSCFNTTAIETITLPNNVTTIPERMFNRCGLLTDVVTTNSITTIGKRAFFCDDDSVKSELATQNSSFVGNGLNLSNVTTIDQSAFSTCSKLKSVIHLDSIQVLGERAFCDSSSVQVVDMSKASKISTISQNALGNLKNNSIIYISDTDVESLTNKYQGVYTASKTALAITNGGIFVDDTGFENDVLATPMKNGMIFNGWYKDEQFQTEADKNDDEEFIIKKNSTGDLYPIYYVKWKQSKYSVDDKVDFGTIGYGDKAVSKDVVVTTSEGTASVKSAMSSNENAFTVSYNGAAVTITPNANLAVGNYNATIYVTTGDGATHFVDVTLSVNPKPSQINNIPVINADNQTITVGDSFDAMAGVTASDKEDGNLTDKIEIINNTVDTSKADTYTVTYKVTDKGGASVTKTITVTVKDKEKEEEPTTPTKPDKGDNNTVTNAGKQNTTVKTGDSTTILLWSMVTVISFAGVITALFFKRRKSE